jgi:hypothetical protein
MPLTTVSPGMLDTTAQYYSFKNRIINGAMVISQRGTSFSTPAAGAYNLDRWLIGWGGAAPATVAQVTGPTGFKNALQVTGAASNTLTQVIQRIESYNCSDLSGATVTLQANIATSSSQTVLWVLKYANTQDTFSSVTTISSGTWSATSTATTFSATVSGLPAGAINGLQLEIYPNNAGAFTSGTITITGVQLEKGSTATSFDYRPYGTELALCQRYFEMSYDIGTAPSTATTTGMKFINWAINGANSGAGGVSFQVPKRATPTIATYDGAGTINNVSTVPNGSTTFTNGRAYSGAPYNISTNSFTHQGQVSAGNVYNFVHFTASSEL